LTLWRWVAAPLFLLSLVARQREAGYEKGISFGVLGQLIAAALVEHRGRGRKRFQRGREQGLLTATPQAVYQKLGRVPLGLSEAWLAESTERIRPGYPTPAALLLPPSVQALRGIVVDGKAIKGVAQRLKPRQGRNGGVLGGKALVALELRSGLVVARATDPDGETNDAKVVPALLPQVRSHLAGKRVWVADRQFCDLRQTAAFTAAQDHFVVRSHPKTHFCPELTRPVPHGHDPQGRVGGEDWGGLGCERAQPRRLVRRITLYRPGAETGILLTDWLDVEQYPANDLWVLYLVRWGIERVFQQSTAVFHLQALIGTTPQGTVFQWAFGLLLYNLGQGVRADVATAQARPVATLSTELLFNDVQRQLGAFTELGPSPQVESLCAPLPSPDSLCEPLPRRLETVWTPRWLKAPAKKPKAPTARKAIPGHQTSVYRLLVAYHQQGVISPAQ
jgi:Transposase DDE domain